MHRISLQIIFLAVAAGVMLGGCLAKNSDSNGSVAPAQEYYYDEFPDIAIPQGMEAAKERYITFSQSGQKIGISEFSGRIELFSLVEAMQQYLIRDGWQLRSSFRSKRTILIFDKQDRMCSLLLDDGFAVTRMTVYVTAKLQDGIIQYSVPVKPGALPSTKPLSQ
ncbi:MAG: hypothetical protein FWH34_06555 [Desulfovibrionaceae bacterium]|nr:hypothetical protein [Desulfovibrionaceae bacterium]